MKVVLLHGPAKEASRKKLIELKQKFDPTSVMVFEEGTDPKHINDNLVATSLFSYERLVIWENPVEDFQPPATSYQLPTTLILWFDHEISDKRYVLEWVKKEKGEILYFPESKEISVFPFLDFLAEGNMKAFLEIEKLKRAGYEVYYLIIMVFYLLRNLVNIPKNSPKFVQDRLQRQKNNFNLEKIINLYKNILELDFKIKSGLIEPQQAEFVLVNKFMESVVH